MKQHDLGVMNMKFRKRKMSPATYLHVFSSETTDTNDQCVGREVKESWKGRDFFNKVVELHQNVQGERRWIAKFEDDYVKSYNEKAILDVMIIKKKVTEGDS